MQPLSYLSMELKKRRYGWKRKQFQWQNLKLCISAIKDFDKSIKATQIVTKQKNSFKASEAEVVNMVEDQDEKKYASQQFGCNG